MKIVIDAFGGDNAPREIVKGAVEFIKNYEDKTFEICLCGDEKKIKEELNLLGYDGNQISIYHAPDIISNNEIPTKAIKEKTESSLVACFDILKHDENCIGLISAGSTGAILAGGFLKIGRIKGVSRPALSPFLPTKVGGQVLLIDCGANMDANALNLCHFAAMGSAYYTCVTKKENPRVALLNVGTENHKGNELCKEVFPMLQKMNINFVGNMEARDIMSGKYDVVVADGFDGNVLLKSTEGALKLMLEELKGMFMQNIFTKLGALTMKKRIKKMKKVYDFDAYGGSPFLGCKKIIIKSHGSSKATAIVASVNQILALYKNQINDIIENSVKEVTLENLKGEVNDN